jgi:hypothetical protein
VRFKTHQFDPAVGFRISRCCIRDENHALGGNVFDLADERCDCRTATM